MAQLNGITFPDEPSPMLLAGQRGAVMADSAIGSVVGDRYSIDTYSPIKAEHALFALLYVDHLEYIDYALPTAPQIVRLGRQEIASVRRIGYMGTGHLQDAPAALWQAHERVEPGAWTIWHDPDIDPLPNNWGAEGLAFKLQLQNAIWLPHRATDVDQVLIFKERRRSELQALRHHLEELCDKVAANGFEPGIARRELEKVDRALADLALSMQQSNWQKIRGCLDIKMGWSEAIRAVGVPSLAAAPSYFSDMTLPQVAATLGTALLAGVAIESTRGPQKPPASPFAYAARVAKEFGAY